MDYDFDAPQFFDFNQPEPYEEAFNDTWFDRHTEDDNPAFQDDADIFPVKKPKRKSQNQAEGTGVPNRVPKQEEHKSPSQDEPQPPVRTSSEVPTKQLPRRSRVPEIPSTETLPQVVKGEVHTKQLPRRSRVPAIPLAESLPQEVGRPSNPSPKKKARISGEDQHRPVPAGSCDVLEQAAHNSPAANTRGRKRASAEGEGHTRTCTQPPKVNVEAPGAPQPPVRIMDENPIMSPKRENSRRVFRSPSGAEVPKSPLRRSPRKAVKSPYKAPKAGEIPHRTNLSRSNSMRAMQRHPSSGSLNKAGVSNTSDMKRAVSSQNLKGKSTEQMEMERIAEMKKQVALTRKQAQDSYKKSMKSTGYLPIRSSQPNTMPEGFHFKTDSRLKNPNGPAKDVAMKDFTKSLRQALPDASKLPSKPQVPGVTKPQPFKLSTAKSTSTLQAHKFQSAAETVAAFHKNTPERFRSRPKGAVKPLARSGSTSRLADGSRKSPAGLTMAKTPTLSTRARSRPVLAITRAEQEQMEYEEHQKQQFKAHPVNHKIFADKGHGVKKVEPKSVTVPEEFNLYHKKAVSTSDLRVRPEETEKYEFHAKPVDPKMLQGPVGVKPVNQLPITVPKSPAFALKNRVRIPVEVPQVEEHKPTTRSHHVPHPGVPFRPRLDHHHTVPQPFSVEERSKQMLTRKEQKIQQVYEEEKRAREFRAQGYKESPDPLPPKQSAPLTTPEPFHLVADQRGERYKEEFVSKVEQEEREAREAVRFKARPANVIRQDAFQPQKSNKPLTEISDFALNTDTRAAQREGFDNMIKAKEAELQGRKREREERQRREEEEEAARIRQAAVHKATGIKKYKGVQVKPSDKPLTDAHSPVFSTRNRTRFNDTADSDL